MFILLITITNVTTVTNVIIDVDGLPRVSLLQPVEQSILVEGSRGRHVAARQLNIGDGVGRRHHLYQPGPVARRQATVGNDPARHKGEEQHMRHEERKHPLGFFFFGFGFPVEQRKVIHASGADDFPLFPYFRLRVHSETSQGNSEMINSSDSRPTTIHSIECIHLFTLSQLWHFVF